MNLKNTIETLKMEINSYCTESIAFRLFSRSDAFPLYQASLNLKFNEKLAWGPPKNIEDVLVQADLLLREIQSNESIVISMIEKHTGTWIGIIKFSIYKDSLTQSLWFHPNYWGNPIIIYGSSASIDLVFEATELKKIYAKHAMGHVTTEKILRRNGFVYLYNDPVPHANGSFVDCKTHELTIENWQGKSKTAICSY